VTGPKVYKTSLEPVQSKVIGSYRPTEELIEGNSLGFQ